MRATIRPSSVTVAGREICPYLIDFLPRRPATAVKCSSRGLLMYSRANAAEKTLVTATALIMARMK